MRRRILLFVMLMGCFTRLYEYRYFFTLKNYSIFSQSQSLEKRLWEVFPNRCLVFWPYFMKDNKGLKEFLERDLPVTVDTKMSGLGKFTTKINWLHAWIKVEWRGKIWCISRDGRMWLFETGNPEDRAAGNFVWKIPDDGGAVEFDVKVPTIGVFSSPIDTSVIEGFMKEFGECEWLKSADEVTWQRREGMNLFILQINNKRQRIVIYLQPDKYRGQDIGGTIDERLEKLKNDGQTANYIIDATYESKISLRRLK